MFHQPNCARCVAVTLHRSNICLQGVFCFYAGLNLVALVMIFLWVPETMLRTLEELDWVFAVPVREFMRYQVFVVLPWFVKRWILFQRDGIKAPLYHFEHVAANTEKVAASGTVEKRRVS